MPGSQPPSVDHTRLDQVHRGKSLGRLSLQGYAGAIFVGWGPNWVVISHSHGAKSEISSTEMFE
jgi:hypothetical protein